ncbi:excisionase [Photobacterium sp. R1]
MRHIPLKDWAIEHFGFAPSPATLSTYAKTKQISPAPVKFGGKWMCVEDAKFIGLAKSNHEPITDPLVARIFNDGCASTFS